MDEPRKSATMAWIIAMNRMKFQKSPTQCLKEGEIQMSLLPSSLNAWRACKRQAKLRSCSIPTLFLAVLLIAATNYVEANTALADGEFDRLRSIAQDIGRVPVIVHLDVNVQPEATLNSAEVERQRGELKAAQDRVLDSMSAARFGTLQSLKRFDYTPILAFHADIQQLDHLAKQSDVAYISEDWLAEPQLDDSTALIGAPAAWANQYVGTGYAIAILDSGVGPHPFFPSGKIVSEACYSTDSANTSSLCPGGVNSSTAPGSGIDCFAATASGCGHGSHVAGIAAGINGQSSEGTINGVAPSADIIAINVFSILSGANCGARPSPCLTAFSSDIILGLERVKVLSSSMAVAAVNMSLGGGSFTSTCDEVSPGVTDPGKILIDDLAALQIATVVSSGNLGLTDATGAPGCISSAITVGSTTKQDTLSPFSNIASWVDLLAPGSAICSAQIGGGSNCGVGYSRKNGTSMAAPHVAGAWAVLRSRSHGASVAMIRDILRTTGASIPTPSGTFSRIRLDQAANALIEDSRLFTDVPVPHLAWQSSADPKFRYFFIDVPAGSPTLIARTLGSIGDADLYVRFNAKPTTTSYDCRPFIDGSNESCFFNAPSPGRWWIAIRPFTAYSDLDLLASYTRPATSLRVNSVGAENVPIQRFSGPSGTGGTTDYTYNGLPGTTIQLDAGLTGPGGATLFRRWEGCDSVSGNGSRICTVNFEGNRDITAVFGPATTNLRVQSSGIGKVEILGDPPIATGITRYDRSLQRFTEVALEAPAQVYAASFTGWSGECDSTSGPDGRICNVNMGGGRFVVANYDNQDFTIDFESTGASAVSITGNGFGGTTPFNRVRASGDFLEFTAPDSAGGVPFEGWSGCDPPVGMGIAPTGTSIRRTPLTCSLFVDGPRIPIAHYGGYPTFVDFSADFADQHWARRETDFDCGAASIDATENTLTFRTANDCAISVATYTHRGALVDGWISFDWSYSESESHTWIAEAGIVGKPLDATPLAEGGNGGGTINNLLYRRGEQFYIDLRKTQGFGTSELQISNFRFVPLPAIFLDNLFNDRFEQ